MPEQYANGAKFDGKKTRCKTSMLKKCTNTLRIDQFRSKSVEKCSVFITFQRSHDAISKVCRLGFRFQNLPFSKSAGKDVPFSCEREAHSSHFSPFSRPASCERSVNLSWFNLPM